MLTDSAEKQSNGSSAGNANTPFIAEIISLTNAPPELALGQLERMRPILSIFLGGTGQMIGAFLKARLNTRFGPAWQQKFRLLAFDTTEEPLTVQVDGASISLEPEAEFFHIGHVPVPRIMRNIRNLESVEKRLGSILPRLPASVMRGNGAKSVRPLALLALYWHFETVYAQLRQAIWDLAGRELSTADIALQQQGINVVIASSLVGGTGSGLFLDIAYLVRHLFNELGELGQFCHITGMGVLPQAFHGIQAANLHANAGAALEELNHLMSYGNFEAHYPGGHVVHVQEAPFNLYHVLDGVDERGQTWAGILDVSEMAAESIFLQMASQLGRKGENAFDNLDEILIERTAEGDINAFSSVGLGALEFPAPQVATLCANRLLQKTAQESWLAAPSDVLTARIVAEKLQPVMGSDLNRELQRDPDGGVMQIDLPQPGWLRGKAHDQVAGAAATYVQEYGQARVNETILRHVEQNQRRLSAQQMQAWSKWIHDKLFAADTSLPQLQAVLAQAQTQLQTWQKESRPQLAALDRELESHTIALNEAAATLTAAAESLVLGRQRRINTALDALFQTAETLYTTRMTHALLRGQRQLWAALEAHLSVLQQHLQTLTGRVQAIAERTATAVQAQLHAVQHRGVSRLSLADTTYVDALFQANLPAEVNLRTLLPQLPDVSVLAALNTTQLTTTLVTALEQPFDKVRQLRIEDVIAERSDEMSVRARRQQLIRLATPSWSIDRARLPEGGTRLARVEVIGVRDATELTFGNQEELVSTLDPHQLVALVVVAGAPQRALQQYDRYRHKLNELRAVRPIYVLPQFMVDSGKARLAFALGSIFGFVYNQGTYFYYQPLDTLAPPVRLGNGLSNAIQELETREGPLREIMERVEAQIARLGLQQSITILAEYYSIAPDGRSSLDELTRGLKQLVRNYADALRQIQAFSSGLKS